MSYRPGKYRLIFGLSLVLFLTLVLGALTYKVGISSSRLCSLCHTMKPQVMTWRVSAHYKTSCETCHIEPGVQKHVGFMLELVPKTLLQVTKQYKIPLELHTPVRNAVCTECHTVNREVTPRNDIIIPHAEHGQNGVYCMDCHQGVAHGRITERKLTHDRDAAKWTLEFAKEQMAPGNTRIGMKECMECHQKREKGPLNCEGCHEEMVTPDSHFSKNWLGQQHGEEAIRDIIPCEKCHNYTNIEGKPLTEEEKDVAKYVRVNSFCWDCHLNSKSPHENGWAFDHCYSARGHGDHCLACHDLDQPEAEERSSTTYCNQCHQGNLGPAFIGLR